MEAQQIPSSIIPIELYFEVNINAYLRNEFDIYYALELGKFNCLSSVILIGATQQDQIF